MAFLLILVGFCTSNIASAETCQECMSQCPHLTRDTKPCDRGCPELCSDDEAAQIQKFQRCSECMSQCPHLTRDLIACDRGCPKICDNQSLGRLLNSTKRDLAKCQSTSNSSAAVSSTVQKAAKESMDAAGATNSTGKASTGAVIAEPAK